MIFDYGDGRINTVYYIAGDMVNYLIIHDCVQCNTYGDQGSEWFKFPNNTDLFRSAWRNYNAFKNSEYKPFQVLNFIWKTIQLVGFPRNVHYSYNVTTKS
jgi:hypothetical protein